MTRARRTSGRILFVGAGPGDPDLLTVGARKALSAADVVVVDSAVPSSVVALAPVVAVPAEGDPAAVAKVLVAEAKQGHTVVRLVLGDPFGSDSVVKELTAVHRSSVAVHIMAGVSASTAVPSYAGVPLGAVSARADLRDTGSSDPHLPDLATLKGTLVLELTADEAPKVASALIEAGRNADSAAALTVNGTRLDQATALGTLGSVADGTVDVATLTDGGAAAGVVLVVGTGVSVAARLAWWENRALYGWQILVPRTKDQAGEMSDLLRAYGAIPVEVPTIAVEPPRTPAQMERAIKGLVTGRYGWIVFTSTNAVRAVWEKFGEFGLDARAFAGVKIACVGTVTADAVRAFGIEPELLPSGDQSSAGLLEDFPPYDDILDPIDRILLPRADIATETLAEGLRDRGWEIDDVTAYRTVRAAPPPADTREAIKGGGFDAVCFTSSSTARNLVGIAGKPHLRTVVACIGPQTAATAKEFGLRVDVQPEAASVPALVEALAAYAVNLRETEGLAKPARKTKSRAKAR